MYDCTQYQLLYHMVLLQLVKSPFYLMHACSNAFQKNLLFGVRKDVKVVLWTALITQKEVITLNNWRLENVLSHHHHHHRHPLAQKVHFLLRRPPSFYWSKHPRSVPPSQLERPKNKISTVSCLNRAGSEHQNESAEMLITRVPNASCFMNLGENAILTQW